MATGSGRSLERIFNEALEKESPAERAAYLDGACGNDADLRGRVDALLRAHEQAGGFLNTPIIDPEATIATSPLSEGAGTRIGRYKLLQQIGEGGFGVVYMAEQEEPVRRKVALKIIKLGMDTRQVIARFEAERQALALMDHPNIARVLDGGTTETGRPYFVMELVKGIPITEYCDKSKLSTRERLNLFVEVCHAVQHAHQKGIIHRDIKPNNVLVTLHDATPVPKVIDFGIAKATSQRLTEKTLFTEFRQFIGTPEYMSPDQAEISGLDVDTRTDIYSLGVLLYELLTGTTPFDANTLRTVGYEEIKRIIREVEPPKPSTRAHTLIQQGTDIASRRQTEPAVLPKLMRGDLDWIVMKAMDKDRTRRYETANELANDVLRHLNHEPVIAGPPSVRYKLGKFIRRNQASVVAGGLVLVALVSGLMLATTGFIQANAARSALKIERDAAESARAEAEQARLGERQQRLSAEAHAAEAQREAEKATLIANFMQKTIASVDPSQVLGREVTVRYVLDEAARGMDAGSLAGEPEVEAALRMTVGKTYLALGLYVDAEKHLRAAEAIRRRVLGVEHPDTLRAGSELAGLLSLRGEYAQAEAMFRRIIEAQQRIFGEEHIDTLKSLNGLGIALWRQNRNEEAEEIHRRVLDIQLRLLGEEHIDTLRSMVNLGTVLLNRRKLAEAEGLLRRALEIERRVLGEEHPETQTAVNNLGLVLENLNRYEDAEELFRRALEMDRRVLGRDHPRTQIPLHNLLRVLRAQGKRKETQPLVFEELEQRRRLAEQPDASPGALNSYAWMLLTCEFPDLRDAAKALPLAQRAVELDGGQNANYLDTLAQAHEMTGNLPRAIEAERLAVARARQGGPYDRGAMEARLVNMLLESGDVVAAGQVVGGTLVQGLVRSPVTRAAVSTSLVERGRLLLEQDKPVEAEPVLRRCLNMRSDSLPPGHWMIAEAKGLLGAALAGQGRYSEAEPLLIEGYEELRDNPDAASEQRRRAAQRLIDFYENWGKPEQAAKWRGESRPMTGG